MVLSWLLCFSPSVPGLVAASALVRLGSVDEVDAAPLFAARRAFWVTGTVTPGEMTDK